MTVYSISDLHMSCGDKPMDVFGANWENHVERICDDWRSKVTEEDLVLLPGDFSWAMHLREAVPHLALIASLPGRKVLLRGNHDFWWSAIGRVREALPEGMYALQNDALVFGECVLAGTRGWLLPGEDTDAGDRKIFDREMIRLRLSLEEARRVMPEGRLIVMLHFPPATLLQPETPFTELMSEFRPEVVIYGHLHGQAARNALIGRHNGIEYRLVSCDALDFRLAKIIEG